MNLETAYEPSPTPPKAFRALRSDPTVKTPPPPPGKPLATLMLDAEDELLEALERSRAVSLGLDDLTRRATR